MNDSDIGDGRMVSTDNKLKAVSARSCKLGSCGN